MSENLTPSLVQSTFNANVNQTQASGKAAEVTVNEDV